jgi:hypothetical protein
MRINLGAAPPDVIDVVVTRLGGATNRAKYGTSRAAAPGLPLASAIRLLGGLRWG